MAMELQKAIIYLGVLILLALGIYSSLTGLASQGLLWILIGIFFFATYKQAGRPLKAVKPRKIIVMVCAFILLVLGGYSLYQGQVLSAMAWVVASVLGFMISFMLKGFEDFKPL